MFLVVSFYSDSKWRVVSENPLNIRNPIIETKSKQNGHPLILA